LVQGLTSNFRFLRDCDARLFRLTTLAEQYAFSDPAAALVKLRQFGEFLAKDIAARHAMLPDPTISFDDVLRALRARSILPREAADWLFHLKRAGNTAAHEDVGTASDALTALKVARATAIWFCRSYGGAGDFKSGPFVPPLPPTDATNELIAEIEALRAEVVPPVWTVWRRS
jgi:type I restriction enzyme, R subunit